MNIPLIRVLKMVFLIYQKHMSFDVFQIGHSTLNSVSSVKTTAKLSLGERKKHFCISRYQSQSLAVIATRVTQIGKDYWLPKMSYHHSPHPHYHRKPKVKHYVILLHEIFQTLLPDVFSVGCWYSKFIHFSLRPLTMAHLNGLPGQGSQRIRLNKQVRRMISKFGQYLALLPMSHFPTFPYLVLSVNGP